MGLTVRATSSRSVSVTWMPPLRDQQNGILRYYLIILTSAGGTVTRNVSSNHQSASIAGLSPYTQYNCTIQAGTIAIGPSSDMFTVYTPQDGEFKKKEVTFNSNMNRAFCTLAING